MNFLKNQNKIFFNILFIIIVFIFFFDFKYTNATQGACSDHGGVYCSIGADYDGSVVCNDGWKDSSVYYSDADECKQSTCTYPTSSGCKTESDYATKSLEINRIGGYLGYSASGQSALNQCRAEIDAYQLELQNYENCVANSSTSSSTSNYSSTYTSDLDSYIASKMQEYCVSAYGSQSYYYSANKTCRCNDGYKFGKNDQCVSVNSYCNELYGVNSSYDSFKNSCTCNSGYQFDSASGSCKLLPPTCPANSSWGVITNKCYCNNGYVDSGGACISYNQDCQNKLGPNSYGDASNCYCSAGYEFDGNTQSCVLGEIKISKPENIATVDIPEKPQSTISTKNNSEIKKEVIAPKSNQEKGGKKDETSIDKVVIEDIQKEDFSEIKNTEIKSKEGVEELDQPESNFFKNILTSIKNVFQKSFKWFKYKFL